MHFFSSLVAGMFPGLQEKFDACKARVEKLVTHWPNHNHALLSYSANQSDSSQSSRLLEAKQKQLLQTDLASVATTVRALPLARRPREATAGGSCRPHTGELICLHVRDSYGFRQPLLVKPSIKAIRERALLLWQQEDCVRLDVNGTKITEANMESLGRVVLYFEHQNGTPMTLTEHSALHSALDANLTNQTLGSRPVAIFQFMSAFKIQSVSYTLLFWDLPRPKHVPDVYLGWLRLGSRVKRHFMKYLQEKKPTEGISLVQFDFFAGVLASQT